MFLCHYSILSLVFKFTSKTCKCSDFFKLSPLLFSLLIFDKIKINISPYINSRKLYFGSTVHLSIVWKRYTVYCYMHYYTLSYCTHASLNKRSTRSLTRSPHVLLVNKLTCYSVPSSLFPKPGRQ